MMDSALVTKPKKNKFDLSREVKMTGGIGKLYPCFIQDVIPGDSFRVNTQQLIRFAPLKAPMMHNIDFKVDYFFVPYRLVWDEWKDFITGGEDGTEYPSYPKQKVTQSFADDYLFKGSLADYLGVPPKAKNNESTDGAWTSINNTHPQLISQLPARAYQLIWHEYFRDQNVGDEHEQYTSSGFTTSASMESDIWTLRRSNWEKDYFTSALPFLQRGGEVTLPLGDTASIIFDDTEINKNYLKHAGGGTFGQNNYSVRTGVSGGEYGVLQSYNTTSNTGGGLNVQIDNSASLLADLSNATAATVNELRKATALQRWLELMARAGSRYREQIHAIFGERIPDFTVQVPQYLGGGKTPIMISEILSTYASEGSTDRPQGDMSGHALGLGKGLGFTQSFDEHGIILGLARVIPKTAYNQGLGRFWQKFDKFDHYFPQFANLGEQEIYNKEIFVEGKEYSDGYNLAQPDDEVFGYQQRYAEYKYSFNRIAGDFRNNLAQWEMSRRFDKAPLLNQSFIECETDNRIFAVTDDNTDNIWISLYHQVDALRPIPYHSNPSLT